jgi:signal transduction histidine kinase/ligand-binding sensor domain-containing protein
MAEKEDGTLLLGTTSGIFELGPKAGRPKYLPLHNPRQEAEGDQRIKGISQDSAGRWWVTTYQFLLRFDPANGEVAERITLPRTPDMGSIHLDRWGNMWIIAGYRLYLADSQLRHIHEVTHLPGLALKTLGAFRTMIEDREGDMWFGSENVGVIHVSHRSASAERFYRRIGAPNALPSDRITTLYEDRDGDIWVGFHDTEPVVIERNYSGATHLSFHPQNERGLKSALATSVFETSADQVLVGTGGAIQLWDEKHSAFRNVFPSLLEKDVFDVRRDASGRIWFATNKGIARLDARRNAWDWLLTGKDVFRFFTDRKGELWVLTRDELFLYSEPNRSFLQFASAGLGDGFYAIAEAPNGDIWLGSTLGLRQLNAQTRETHLFPYADGNERGPSDPRVNSLLFSRNGDLWVGTQSGLDLYNPSHKTFQPIAKVDQLGGQIVSCILEDDHQRLWLSSNQGLLTFNPKTKVFSEYSGTLGLPSVDLSGWGACSKGVSGKFYFGGFGGVIGFLPDKLSAPFSTSNLVLTALLINGRRVNVEPGGVLHQSISRTSELHLNYGDNDVSFEFASFDFRDWRTSRYQYRLEGQNSEWRPLDVGQHTVMFSHLPSGHYTLQIREVGGPGEHGVTLPFTIAQPWWATWWMWTLYCLVFFLALKLAYDYRLRRLRTIFAAITEARVRERTSLARDLHDTLLQDFQGLVLRFASVILRMPPNDSRREELTLVVAQVEKALIEGRDALQTLRTSPMRLTELAGAFRELAQDLSFLSTARVNVVVDDKALLDCEYDAQEIYKLGKEALRNALQHAQAQNIEIWFTSSLSNFTLIVSDDGIGIPDSLVTANSVPRHWGLRGMRERADRLGGQLEFVKSERKGTTLRVILPNQNIKLKLLLTRLARFKLWFSKARE